GASVCASPRPSWSRTVDASGHASSSLPRRSAWQLGPQARPWVPWYPVLPSSSGGRFPVHLWVVSVLSAALFAAIHGAIGGWLFAGHLVAALVWTWAASRLGGIEAGAGAHAAGNLLLLTLLVTGVTLPASHGPAAFATLLLTDATTIAIVLLLARRLPRLTG